MVTSTLEGREGWCRAERDGSDGCDGGVYEDGN